MLRAARRLRRLVADLFGSGARYRGRWVIAPPGERTRAMFERLPGHVDPPLIPLAGLGDDEALQEFGVAPGALPRMLFRLGFEASGFGRFTRLPPAELDAVLRYTDSRQLVCAPILSASVMLADDPAGQDMLSRAAALVAGALQFRRDLLEGRVAQGVHRGAPLETGLVRNLFGTSRWIEDRRLRLRKNEPGRSVAVVVEGQLHVLRWEGEAVPDAATWEAGLADVVAGVVALPVPDRQPAVGMLTADADDAQIRSFTHLAASPENRATLQSLAGSEFVVCLEPACRPASSMSAIRLANSGSYGNRWSHASCQLVVFGNGMAAVVFAWHCWLDGNEMVAAAAEFHRRSIAKAQQGARGSATLSVDRLRWRVDDAVVDAAADRVAAMLDADPLSSFTIEGCGRKALAVGGRAPVPVFVVALGLAVHELTGRVPSIHQFLAMSKYRFLGVIRVEVTAPAFHRCIESLIAGVDASATVRALLDAAIEAQAARCSLARSRLPLTWLHRYFDNAIGGVRNRLSRRVEGWTLGVLRRLGWYRPPPCDILISHPDLDPAVQWVGRPGVIVPYVPMFTLHYSLRDGCVQATVARGAQWSASNQHLHDALVKALNRVTAVLEAP